MNWGYKIITVYAIFVAGIVWLVVKSSMQNQDLVATDYYEQELTYQKRIEETERANALSADVNYTLKDKSIDIRFPAEMSGKSLKANIWLYCVSDQHKDIKKEIRTENGEIIFELPAGNKGQHQIKMSWEVGGVTYYNQRSILIQ